MHRSHPVAERLAAVVMLVVVAAGAGAYAYDARVEHHIIVPRQTVASARSLAVQISHGRVRVERGSGDAITIDRSARFFGRRPGYSLTRTRGRLSIESRCASAAPGVDLSIFGGCDVDLVVRVPGTTALRVVTDGGDIELVGLGGVIMAETGFGDIRGSGLRASDATFDTGTGDVNVRFRERPRQISSDTGTGDVRLAVPRGGYRLALDSGVGSKTVDGITDDPASDAKITADTGVGDIIVEAIDG